jgi:hypothetical protein
MLTPRRTVISSLLLLASAGCGSDSAESEATSPGRSAGALESTCDPIVAAGDGWRNRPVPSATGVVGASWRSQPNHDGGVGPIDAVIGFSSGAANGFIDLGPIVRFGPHGYIDARDGSTYAGAFSYTFGDGPYDFQLLIDIPRHRYSAFVRNSNGVFKPFDVLAQEFAFRTEQSGVAQLDHQATFVDSPFGGVEHCGYAHGPAAPCAGSSAGSWQSRRFTTIGDQHVRLDFYAWVTAPDIDAVIGASSGAPAHFRDLAAVVRFHPDGYFDARNGSVYAADVQLGYAAGSFYRVTLDLDLSRSSYSVSITPPSQGTITIARDYAFRTEQGGIASVDHIAQFVDGTPGMVATCGLVTR